MALGEWSKSNAVYAGKLVRSGIEGARDGSKAFVNGEPLVPLLTKSARRALKPAALGICLGALSGYPSSRHHSLGRMLARGVLGGVIGLGTGLAWEGRHLTASAARAAGKNIERVREEQWWIENPIDYASSNASSSFYSRSGSAFARCYSPPRQDKIVRTHLPRLIPVHC
jgi:hypothetical protein